MVLTDELRRMVGAGAAEYTVNGVAYWTDEQLAELLASNSFAYRAEYVQLEYEQFVGGARHVIGGNVFAAGVIDPADKGTLVDREGIELDDIEWSIDRAGALSFEIVVTDRAQLRWSGTSYDLHGAAADALDGWVAHVADAYDVDMDGQSLSRSQMREGLEKRAEHHRALALKASGAAMTSVPFTGESM